MDKSEIEQRLIEERTRLERLRQGREKEGIEDESEESALSELTSLDQHPADVGSETFEREKEQSVLEQIDAQLSDVADALQGLDEGTYGKCEACGRPIAEERLLARPTARYCIEHQVEADRGVQPL